LEKRQRYVHEIFKNILQIYTHHYLQNLPVVSFSFIVMMIIRVEPTTKGSQTELLQNREKKMTMSMGKSECVETGF